MPGAATWSSARHRRRANGDRDHSCVIGPAQPRLISNDSVSGQCAIPAGASPDPTEDPRSCPRTSRMTAVAAAGTQRRGDAADRVRNHGDPSGHPAHVPPLTDGMPAAGCTRQTVWGAELVMGGSSNTDHSPKGMVRGAVQRPVPPRRRGERHRRAGRQTRPVRRPGPDAVHFVHAATFNEFSDRSAIAAVDPAFGVGGSSPRRPRPTRSGPRRWRRHQVLRPHRDPDCPGQRAHN